MAADPSHPPRSWKLPASFNGVAMPFVLSALMSGIISGVSAWRSVGFAQDLAMHWLATWGVSWSIAFPTVFLILPLAHRLVAAAVEPMEAAK